MFYKTFLAGALACCGATCVFADFTYEQTTKVTGGMMAGAMKIAGAFSKAAREPMTSTVVVKGDKMATISPRMMSIVDLQSETITSVDMDKKQYSVMTFAEMTQAIQRMSEKMSQKNAEAEMHFKVSAKNTGQTKLVNGFNAKETVLTMTVEGTDKKSGHSGAMDMIIDMWLAPKVAGYGEVQDFHKRMAQKLAWTPGGMGMAGAMGNPQMMKGMAEASKEMSKMEGIPVLTVMKMGVAGMPEGGAQGNPQSAQAPPPQQKDIGEAAGSSAGSALGRKLGGGFGGLAGGALGGGFGRKKKQQEEQAPAEKASTPPAQAGDASSALMEMTTEMTSFSSAPVDSARFQVPAGFKKVESDMNRALRQ